MSNNDSLDATSVEHYQFVCKKCNYELDYEIGQNSLVCQSCGEVEPIETQVFNIFHANPYDSTVMDLIQDEPDIIHHHVRCNTCGAGFDFPQDTHADECPYCDSNIIVPVKLQRQLSPDAVLPFEIKEQQANVSFRKWIKSLWFAPNSLKRLAMRKHPIQGTYIPYWGFDANTYSKYSGQRGTNYTTTVTVRINGKTQTRLVTKIRWRYVSGNVTHEFDNVLVPASEILANHLTMSMKNWKLAKATNYNPKFLSGYKSELYQVGLPRGLTRAKKIMTTFIRGLVRSDIGGDHQRISSLNSRYERVGFKLILMPLWISAFLYNRKTFQFII
ncbi:MAG: primosomal protein N' (replication factor Y) - superfamily II helicase, partial [Proteobacteria bacterium]|nr:primosomal protein N' (replication factor Y) - superfamily II helicase [Pseudomonadota bacterium]